MRNSKIILGALTLVLGIAGAVSTMATTRVATLAHVWATTIGHTLTCLTISTPCTLGNLALCKTAQGTQVYTIGSECVTPFRKNVN